MSKWPLLALLFASFALANCVRPQPSPESTNVETVNVGTVLKDTENPEEVSTCDLLQNRAAYDRKVIEVTTFVINENEDFTLFDPECPVEFQNIWLEYGGKKSSSAVYCCDVAPSRERPQSLRVDDLTLEILDDEKFKAFDRMVHDGDSMIRTMLIGRFFAGRPPNKDVDKWHGFGHLGIYSMFVIQRVTDVKPRDREDLNYASPGEPAILDSYKWVQSLSLNESALEIQKAADHGAKTWRFDDPKRVARDALIRAASLSERQVAGIEVAESRNGYGLFQLTTSSDIVYFVEVSRDHWLIYYAKDPNRIVWRAIKVYEMKRKRSA